MHMKTCIAALVLSVVTLTGVLDVHADVVTDANAKAATSPRRRRGLGRQ